MTNGEKYKTFDERRKAHGEYCKKMADTPKCIAMHNSCGCAYCALEWLVMEAEEPKLLPCPFCGGEARIIICGCGCSNYYHVKCKSCFCASPSHPQKDNAVSVWNRRVK